MVFIRHHDPEAALDPAALWLLHVAYSGFRSVATFKWFHEVVDSGQFHFISCEVLLITFPLFTFAEWLGLERILLCVRRICWSFSIENQVCVHCINANHVEERYKMTVFVFWPLQVPVSGRSPFCSHPSLCRCSLPLCHGYAAKDEL